MIAEEEYVSHRFTDVNTVCVAVSFYSCTCSVVRKSGAWCVSVFVRAALNRGVFIRLLEVDAAVVRNDVRVAVVMGTQCSRLK